MNSFKLCQKLFTLSGSFLYCFLQIYEKYIPRNLQTDKFIALFHVHPLIFAQLMAIGHWGFCHGHFPRPRPLAAPLISR